MNDSISQTLRLHPGDNVVVARTDLEPGSVVEGSIRVLEPIPAGHKVATAQIAAGEPIVKYASPIGVASHAIASGNHVHSHNVRPELPTRVSAAAIDGSLSRTTLSESPRSFDAFVRADGRIATRNYIGIITTVNCSGTVAKMISSRFDSARLRDYSGVDGVVALAHTSGCAMSKASEGFRVLRRTLAGYARHPNFAGVLVLGLGCEQNQTDDLLEDFALKSDARVDSLVIQEAGGTRPSVEAGVARVERLLRNAAGAKRQPVPASQIKLALECGGSDGYSGISANPALGAAADLIVAQGGTVVLSETPEIIGAEHVLIQRAASPEVARSLAERVAWWREYTSQHGVSVGENPSEGNRRGGITTIYEKSLGAVAKSGTSPLMDVIEYGAPLERAGLVFMDSPGYDPVAVTGQVAAGCNVICFTTGRGSVFGCRPVPSIKLSTNTALYQRMSGDIDLDCGGIIEGRESVEAAGQRIFEFILKTASGRLTCSEELGFGADEFVPWQLGAVL